MGRTKEIMNVLGHKVSPTEIEDVLSKHGHVELSVVAGIPMFGGDCPMAFVMTKNTTEVCLMAHKYSISL